MKEVSERYNIPIKILKEYEKWEPCGTVKKVMGAWQYDDQDIERLSMIMTLHDMGFNNGEAETYMRLTLEGDHTEPEQTKSLTVWLVLIHNVFNCIAFAMSLDWCVRAVVFYVRFKVGKWKNYQLI